LPRGQVRVERMIGGFQRVNQAKPSFFEDLFPRPVKFVDTEFPPSFRSIIGDLTDPAQIKTGFGRTREELENAIWLRFDDIFGEENYRLFSGKIEPDDVFQGNLGNCYHLASLSALAEVPKRVRRLFKTKSPNKEGRYEIQMYDMGILKTVTVDDFIPCDPKTRMPLFATTNQNELWVLLLEKAWAKIYGSYGRIIGGLPEESLHDLTGAPNESYFFEREDIVDESNLQEQFWENLHYAESKNYIMNCGTVPPGVLTEKTLVPGHIYTLISVHQIEDAAGNHVRLVKLRNPHGKFEWKGAWSDQSPNWTPKLKDKLGFEEKEDGVFFIQYEEMLNYLNLITICKIDDLFFYECLESSCDKDNAIFFKLKVKTAGSSYITINQECLRKYAKNYKYSEVKLSLFPVKNGKTLPIKKEIDRSNLISNREFWEEYNLEKGLYFVQVEISWDELTKKKFSISYYGPSEVEITETFSEIEKKLIKEIKRTQQAEQAERDWQAFQALLSKPAK